MKFSTDSNALLRMNCNNSADPLKGNSTGFTHQSLFIGLGEYYCLCEKSCIKSFVAPKGAVSHKLLQVMSCESMLIESECYKFKMRKHLGMCS